MTDEIRDGDRVHIEGLEVFGHVGVSDEERASAQRLVVNVTFWPHRRTIPNDDINQTVDYAAVCAETRAFVQAQKDRLVETLADRLALHLLDVFEICRITVEIRKFILPTVKFISVTMTRDAGGVTE